MIIDDYRSHPVNVFCHAGSLMILLTSLVSYTCFSPAVFAQSPAEPTGASVSSRFIDWAPIDDGGLSSGSHAVTICLPAGYDSTARRYPVFYVLDGGNAFYSRKNGMRDAIGYEVVHDQLVHDGLIDPVIFVAIHNSTDANGNNIPGNRGQDYAPPGHRTRMGDDEPIKDTPTQSGYYQFLAHTIKPMVDKAFRTLPEPATTGITGFSAGGLGAFWMTYLHPETFGMGICQSPALWANRISDELLARMTDRKYPMPPVRLWMDAGSLEYDFIYKDAFAAYRTLVTRGFEPGKNIAFYTGHNHGHEQFDCHRRMRSAMYFILGKKPPTFTGAEITSMATVDGDPIILNKPGHIIVETIYDHGLRLTHAADTFTIADPSVVALDPETHAIRPLATGRTTINSFYDGRRLVQQIEVPAFETSRPCLTVSQPVMIDGDLTEWTALPQEVNLSASNNDSTQSAESMDLSYRFGCSHDEQFLYIAIATTDDHIQSVAAKDPWFQDGVEVRVDARPAGDRTFAPGEKEGDKLLLVAMSPSSAGESRLPFKADKLPPGTKAVCNVTATGHNTEIAIPIAYLNSKAGKPWTDIRINIVVNDLDSNTKGAKVKKTWWRPDWRTANDIRGSGNFER